MRVVHKYPLGEHGGIEIPMPMGAKILTADVQSGKATLWALVDPDPDLPVVNRYFMLVETGHRLAVPEAKYVATLLFDRGSYVLHVFEVAGD